MSEPRNLGSTLTAVAVGAVLMIFAAYLGLAWWCGRFFDVGQFEKVIDIGSCAIFGAVLLWWGLCKPFATYDRSTAGKIGFETITMIVTVITALIAIFTLTDAAAHRQSGQTELPPAAASR